ncbi:MAG: hypothetical protein ABIV39_11060, partial [Verrucomicrobiota bacterium]
MSTKARFKILPFNNPSGVEVFRVSGCKKDGSRIRENFPSMTTATIRQQELEAEFHGLDSSSRLSQTRLSPAQVAEAEVSFNRLGNHPMAFAVDWFLKNYKESAIKILVADARDKFIAEKKKANR